MTIEKIPAARLNPAAYNPRKDLKLSAAAHTQAPKGAC